MEIGLTAKVKPDVDERTAKRQASTLRSKFEDAVSDLPAMMDLDEVMDRTTEMQEDVEEMSEDLEDVSEMDMPNTQAPQDQGPGLLDTVAGAATGGMIGEAPGGGGDGQGGGPGGGPMDMIGEKFDQFTGKLGRLGTILTAGAAVIAIGGLALGYLSDTVDKLSSTSPLLGQVVDMFGLAMTLFFRPFASIIGQLLLPIATNMIQLASEFNTVFREEGIGNALAFLSMEILLGLAHFSQQIVEGIVSGLSSGGRQLVLGGDGQFGIGDAIRVAIIGAFAKAAIGKILSRGVLSMLPRITAARVISLFTVPGLGQKIAQYFGSTLMRASVTELIEAAFRQLLQRAFGPAVASAPIKVILKAAFQTLVDRFVPSIVQNFGKWVAAKLGGQGLLGMIRGAIGRISGGTLIRGLLSKLPSIGVRAFLSRVLPSIGVRAFLTRVLPSVGFRALLSKIGLAAIVKVLGSRIAYLIPVVGQAIAIIDLLVFIITALIPGMEAFSPIMWTLTQIFNLLVWAATGLWSALKGFWDWLTGIDLGNLLPSISVGGLISGMFAFVNSPGMSIGQFLGHVFAFAAMPFTSVLGFLFGGGGGMGMEGISETLGSIWSWILSVMDPVMTLLSPVAMILGIFASLGIAFYEAAMAGWDALKAFLDDPVGALEGLFSGAMELGEAGISSLISGGIDLWNWIEGGARDVWYWIEDTTEPIWNWVDDTSHDIWNWVTDTSASIWDWVSSTSRDIFHWIGGTSRDIWYWITSTSRGIWHWVTNTSRDIFHWIGSTSRDIWHWVTNTGRDIWHWISNSSRDVWHWITDSARDVWHWINDTARDVFYWITSTSRDIFHWINRTSRDIFHWINRTSRDIFHWINRTSRDIWHWVNDTYKDIWDWINDVYHEIWEWVNMPDIDLIDHINLPDIDLGDHIDVPDIDLGDYISRPDWLGGSAEGRVATSPGVTAVAEKEPEVIVPFSKLGTFVRRMSKGASPSQALRTPETDSLPALAEGGIVTRATTALVGEGSESEAVLPLSKLSSLLGSPDSPDMTGGGSGGGSGTVEVDLSSEIGGSSSEMTPREIASAVRDAIGSQLNDVSTSVDELARKVEQSMRQNDGPIKITADGKVLAEVNASGKDKYKRTRDVTK